LTNAFIIGTTGLAMLSPWVAGAVFPLGIGGLIVWSHVRRKRAESVKGFIRGETLAWFSQLQRFHRERQLESRSHPELIPELEACAELRTSILEILKNSDWQRLSRQQGWDHVEGLCREVAEDLMVDAVWAARTLFRALGGHKSTFEALCSDPAHSLRPLTPVRLARAQLEKLLDDVSDFPLASLRTTDALARAQVEMESLRAAEREIHGSG
jgi:hypothetical protein